jgi:hypothetical protein
VAGRVRTGADGAHNPGCFRLHHGHHESGDDRTRTGGRPADNRLLWPLSYVPEKKWKAGSAPLIQPLGNRGQRRCRLRAPEPAVSAGQSFYGAGGIRTHGLELMRLARTAAPLPRFGAEQVWLAGVEPAVSGSRNRRGGPLPYSQKVDQRTPPAGLEPAASGLRARRHRHFDHGGMNSSGGRARTCALAGNNRASFQLDHAGTVRRKATDSNLRAALTPPKR